MTRTIVGLFSAAATAAACGQPCSPHWDASFTPAPDNGVQALRIVVDLVGPRLYVGGKFENIAGQPLSLVASHVNGVWSPLGNGIPSFFNSHGFMGCCAHVRDFVSVNDPLATGVYVAGEFVQIDSVIFESVGRYASGAWTPMAGGVALSGCADCQFRVNALAHFGGLLHAAGGFDTAGGTSALNIAAWNGASWQALGAGLGPPSTEPQFPHWVEALVVYNENGQSRLFAAGAFGRAGSTDTWCVARWDGAGWSAVGGGVDYDPLGPLPIATCMAVYDDGRGPALYLAGGFSGVGGVPANNIARWDGTSWSALGAGIGGGPNDLVRALEVFDDGRGPALYAGGQFTVAGGAPANNIARWNAAAWAPLDVGVNSEVHALESFTDADGPSLYVGGFFSSAGGLANANLARWRGCTPAPPECYANCDGSTQAPILNVADFACFLQQFAAGASYANCDQSTTAPILNVADFTCFLQQFAAGCP